MAAQAVGKIEFSKVDACVQPDHRPRLVERRKPLIVSFGHEAQQGKDTIVNHLVETFGSRPQGVWGKAFPMDVRRYAFADPLKIEVFDWLQGLAFANVYGFAEPTSLSAIQRIPAPLPRKIYSREEKLAFINENKIALRPLLQQWGTEYRRAQRPDYWARETQIKIDYDLPQVALISDMRFLSEAEMCDYRVRVVRKGFTSEAGGHVSEQELKDFKYDYVLEAESVEELKTIGEATFQQILTIKGLLSS